MELIFYQVHLGNSPVPEECYEIEKLALSMGASYILDTTESYPGLDYRAQSNMMRIDAALRHPHLVYTDTDVTIHTWPPPPFEKEGKIYSAYSMGKPHNCFFYVNGDTEAVHRIRERQDRVRDKHSPFMTGSVSFREASHALRIPDGCYTHLSRLG